MKKSLNKFLVIAIAVTGMGCYVWNANRKQQEAAKNAPPPAAATPPATKEAKPLSEKPVVVTDEEVKASRKAMLSSSKSGRIMGEEDARKMLEKQKRIEFQPSANDLAPSSKSSIFINPKEIKEWSDDEFKKVFEP
jgi:hypothetical protein